MHPQARLYTYLTLARTRLFDWVRPLTDEQYRAEHPIGLGSIARTLHHVKGAEASYMRRLIGHTETPPTPAHENNPEVTTETALPFAELEPLWAQQARDTQAALENVTDWSTPAVFQTTWDGAPFAYRASPADFLSQLALHEVHHRAQVLHMLRRTGIETQDIDYNALMWARAGEI